MGQSGFNLLRDVPYIHNTEELEEWLEPRCCIEKKLQSYEVYDDFLTKMNNLLLGSFPIRECREYPIKFKYNEKDKKYHKMQFRHFLVNLILWRPFVELNDLHILDDSYAIYDFNKQIPNIEDYINYKLIETMRDYHIRSTTINFSISDVLYNLRKISLDYSLILGLNFSIPIFTDLYQKNPEIKEIMECSFEENMQPHDIEAKLSKLQAREIEIFKSIPEHPIGVILNAGTGIKLKQLAEFTIAESLKPSIDGKTIPEPIENSTLLKGLDRPSYLFIDATGSRKSLVMNKKVMGKAGHFSKTVLMLARTLSMSTRISDCGTQHPVCYEVKSEKHLKKLNGKYFKESLDETDYKVLNAKNRKDLIGKFVYVRSAATCALKNHVCAKCVGMTATQNFDISGGISAYESEEITKVVEQSILSTKFCA